MVQGRQKTKKVHPNQVKGLFAHIPFYEFFRFPFQFHVGMSILSDLAKHVEHQSALNLTCVINAVKLPVKLQNAVVKLII